MIKQSQITKHKPDPSQFFAQISTAYIEILSGVRRPEQLARWLSDKAYYDLCQRAKRESRARQLTGTNLRPDISVRNSKTFLTDSENFQGVVILQIAGTTKAISVRAEKIHARYRITDLCLI